MTHFSLYPLFKNPKNATLYLNISMPCLEHEPEEMYCTQYQKWLRAG